MNSLWLMLKSSLTNGNTNSNLLPLATWPKTLFSVGIQGPPTPNPKLKFSSEIDLLYPKLLRSNFVSSDVPWFNH
jgi:hypothetical protein